MSKSETTGKTKILQILKKLFFKLMLYQKMVVLVDF